MSPPKQHFEVKTVDGVTLVRFTTASFDSSNIEDIAAELKSLITPGCKVLINLHNVKYLFSESLGQLVSLNSRIKLSHGKLRLCSLHPDAYEIFKVTQLTRVFEIYEDEAEALENF